MAKAIEVKNLVKSFKNVNVLNGINLSVERGTVFALLGPNGAGKTTTVRILSTLLQPDGGTVMVNGLDVVKEPNKVRGVIGLTGQYAAVDEYLSAVENLEMMGRLYHLSAADTKRRTKELLEQFDLVEAAHRPVKTYSGGMRRRLDLALSLIAAPPIIFLDEPTTGLDPRSRLVVWETVKQLVKDGVTVLLTTQYLEEADQLADKIAVIDGGKVIAEGTADELKRRVGNERLEVVIAQADDFDKAVKALAHDTLKADASRRTISIATSDSVSELKRMLDQLQKAKVEIETLSLHKPTLDDVFLELTGHQATMAAEGEIKIETETATVGEGSK